MASTPEREYRVIVDANLITNGGSGGATVSPTGAKSPDMMSSGGTQSNRSLGSVLGAFSAQFAVEQASRLLNATGNQQMASTVSTLGRYTFLGVRALGGDPVAIATLAMTTATKALEQVRKHSEFLNEIDNNMIKSGLTNMESIKVSKNFFTGRQTYSKE